MSNNLVLFCETCADLDYESVQKNNLNEIVVPILLDGKEYKQSIDSPTYVVDFISELRSNKHPTTAVISVEKFKEYFEPHLKAGRDCLYVSFSMKLSSSVETLGKAITELERKYPGRRVYLADTKSVSAGTGIIVLMAVDALRKGASAAEIIKLVEDRSKRIEVVFVVENMKHLKRGGRISSGQAFLATLLGIKPILRTENGRFEKYSKAMGMNKAINFLFDEFTKNWDPTDTAPIIIADASSYENGDILYKKVNAYVRANAVKGITHSILRKGVGPAIMTHCGFGTVALGYTKKR